MVKNKEPFVFVKDRKTAEYLEGIGALIKTRTGYIHG